MKVSRAGEAGEGASKGCSTSDSGKSAEQLGEKRWAASWAAEEERLGRPWAVSQPQGQEAGQCWLVL